MPLDNILTYVILAIALGAILAPIGVRLNNWSAADPAYEPCEDDDLAPDVIRMVSILSDIGFVDRGSWELRAHSRATGQVTLMEHPQTLDLVMVVEVKSRNHRLVSLRLITRFEDGTAVATDNSRLTVGLPFRPGITFLWLPGVRDAMQLYHIHVQARENLGCGKKRLPVGGDPVVYLKAAHKRMFNHYVETGYHYLDEAHGVYRPTWKGALLMSWRLMWLIAPFYRAYRQRRTRDLIRELGIHLEL